jgi:alkanesulfonate monooxygenase SsuD/methylene tetrahydromethanopterin reductase-like flavin-dependent oxidoreductase (luciferase family)
MELGFFTMPLHPPGANMADTLEADLKQLVYLDQLGYSEAWIGEHFTAEWENIPAPDLLIAQALGVTSQIRLGTGVTCMPNHDPFTIAHRIAQLDQMSRGRIMWGVGSGGFPGDLDVHGFDHRSGDNREMTRRAVDLVLQIWNDPKPGNYKSRWWNFNIPDPQDDIALRVHLKPFQDPHPPIGVAGVSPKSETLTMAGVRGWLPMSINFVPVQMLVSHWEAVSDGAASVGKTADRSSWRIAREVMVADSSAEARKQALSGTLARDMEGYFLKLLPKSKMLGLLKIDPNMPDSDVTVEYLVDNIFIVGSPEEATEKLSELDSAVGGFGTLMAMGHEWEPEGFWKSSMGLLKEEVLPKVASNRS